MKLKPLLGFAASLALAGIAAAQLPGIDAPTGAASGSAAGGNPQPGSVLKPDRVPGRTDNLKDPIELCSKLAGVEREICTRQAEENRKTAPKPAIEATPGVK